MAPVLRRRPPSASRTYLAVRPVPSAGRTGRYPTILRSRRWEVDLRFRSPEYQRARALVKSAAYASQAGPASVLTSR
jgi:hypothetical protein